MKNNSTPYIAVLLLALLIAFLVGRFAGPQDLTIEVEAATGQPMEEIVNDDTQPNDQVSLPNCGIILYPVAEGTDPTKTAVKPPMISCSNGYTSANYDPVEFASLFTTTFSPQPLATVLGKAWSLFNRGGATLTFTTSAGGTCAGLFYPLSSMPAGWDDAISSAEKLYSDCDYIKLFVNTNYGGASALCAYCANLSNQGIDNKTSSLIIGEVTVLQNIGVP